MDDLEITKRIAEIEGMEPNIINSDLFENIYRPLHNGNIICDLIEKHEIQLSNPGSVWACETWEGGNFGYGYAIDKDLKRAVCLCLIEAFKDA